MQTQNLLSVTYWQPPLSTRLLARRAPLCSLPVCVLVVFGELPISFCEMLGMAPLFAPICCFRLIEPQIAILVVVDSPIDKSNSFQKSTMSCRQRTIHCSQSLLEKLKCFHSLMCFLLYFFPFVNFYIHLEFCFLCRL